MSGTQIASNNMREALETAVNGSKNGNAAAASVHKATNHGVGLLSLGAYLEAD